MKGFVFAVTLLSLVLRLVVPAGFMPAADAGEWFAPCPSSDIGQALLAREGHHHAHHQAHSTPGDRKAGAVLTSSAYETCAFASLLSDNAQGGGMVHAEIVRFAMADEPAPSAVEPLPIPNLLPLTARGPPVS